MRSAIVYATLIEVVAVVPIFALEGLSGAFFRPLAGAYALALLVSMVIALTVTPAMSLIFFRSGKSHSIASRRSSRRSSAGTSSSSRRSSIVPVARTSRWA